MDKEQILISVKADVLPIYGKLKCWIHGWNHVESVVDAAKDLAHMEGADPFLCQLAAYLHDLGRLEEEERGLVDPRPRTSLGHAFFSLKPADGILRKYKIKDPDRERVLEAIRVHPSRKYEGDNEIALIMQDADRSNGFGPVAMLRFAFFNCEIPIEEPNSESDVHEKVEKLIEVLKADSGKRQRMIETLEYVNDWYDVLLNTKSAKNYIKEDHEYNQDFLESLKNLT